MARRVECGPRPRLFIPPGSTISDRRAALASQFLPVRPHGRMFMRAGTVQSFSSLFLSASFSDVLSVSFYPVALTMHLVSAKPRPRRSQCSALSPSLHYNCCFLRLPRLRALCRRALARSRRGIAVRARAASSGRPRLGARGTASAPVYPPRPPRRGASTISTRSRRGRLARRRRPDRSESWPSQALLERPHRQSATRHVDELRDLSKAAWTHARSRDRHSPCGKKSSSFECWPGGPAPSTSRQLRHESAGIASSERSCCVACSVRRRTALEVVRGARAVTSHSRGRRRPRTRIAHPGGRRIVRRRASAISRSKRRNQVSVRRTPEARLAVDGLFLTGPGARDTSRNRPPKAPGQPQATPAARTRRGLRPM